MPNSSLITFANGPRQLVVHDALEMMFWLPSYLSSLTPMTMVMSSPVAGAEMTTFFAPASRCPFAFSALVKMPVDSTTTSTPRSPHGSAAGPSRTSSALIFWLPTTMVSSPSSDTSSSRMPPTESNFSRCARDLLSARSLTATISMSVWPSFFCASTARKKLRPIRPNPLTPTRTVTVCSLSGFIGLGPHGPGHGAEPKRLREPSHRPA